VLTVTQQLRRKGVVEKFVEFFGPGLAQMALADRATIANMCPEYGATCGFFPVDAETLSYLRRTGRPPALVDLVERYCKEQGLFRGEATPDPVFSETVELDLGTVVPSLAGPKRPQDRVPLTQMKQAFAAALTAPVKERGFGLSSSDAGRRQPVELSGAKAEVGRGWWSPAPPPPPPPPPPPWVVGGAPPPPRKAVARGLTVHPYVKTSLA